MSGDYIAIGSSRRKGCRLLKVGGDDAVSIAWTATEVSSGFGSPLIHRGRVYFVNDAGIAYCYDLDSGDLLWDARLGESNWASPLGAGDRVYFFCRNGETTVIAPSDKFEVLSENELSVGPEDRIYGYAVVPERFILRTTSELVCIGSGE